MVALESAVSFAGKPFAGLWGGGRSSPLGDILDVDVGRKAGWIYEKMRK